MIKNKIVIGILPTYDFSDTNPYKDTDSFIRMYEEKIFECGGIPIGLLNKNVAIYKNLCDAYLWPGGKAIRKEFYTIFDDILENKKPLLGICLGSQAISTYFNILDDQKNSPNLSIIETYDENKEKNKYLEKIEEKLINIHNNDVTKEKDSINNAKHQITIKKPSFMYDIYKQETINVVSLHKHKIARTANDIKITALSTDGTIEAIEYDKNNNHILGVQYHPEITEDTKIFSWLINQASNKK